MKTQNILTAVFAALAALAQSAAAQTAVNFDGRTAGAGSLTELVRSASPSADIPAVKLEADRSGKWNSCQIVELDDRDGVSVNRRVDLSRDYTRQVCENVQITNSAGQYVTVSQCHNETETYYASADLVIHDRQLRGSEKERIQLCYDFLSGKGSMWVDSPFEYTYRDKTGNGWYSVELFPGARKPQAPAAGALQLASFSYDDVRGEFTLKLRNGFGSEYYGRKVHIGVELVQDKLFDSSLGTKFFEFPIYADAGDFTLTFKAADFGGQKDAEALRAKAKNFYAKWGFKVKGEGFTDAYVEGGRTGAVQVIR